MATNFFVVMRLTEQVSRPLRRAASSANQMTMAADRMSVQLQAANAVMVGTAAAATALVGSLSSSAAQLENSIARLETVTRSTAGSVQTALGNAESAARDFSAEYTATASEFIDAQFQIATAGIAVEEQVAATAGAFKLARATVGEFTQSAQLLGSFLNTFGKSAEFNYLRPAEKVEAITDRLSTAVQRFQVTLPVLAESFKFIVGPASTLNLNLGEVTAALGVLNTAGFRGTLAGTALSNVFNKLDRAVEKLDLNPDKFIDLNGELKDLTSFFQELNRALGDSTPIEKQNKLISTFDIRAGRVIKTLLDNIDALKQFRGELDISTGATERLANIVENTTSAQFKKFINQLQNIATIIGGELNQALRPFIKFLVGVAKSVGEFVEANKTWITTLLASGAALLSVVVAATAFGFIVRTIVGGIAALATKSVVVTSTVTALGAAFKFLTSPVQTTVGLLNSFTNLLQSGAKSLLAYSNAQVLAATSTNVTTAATARATITIKGFTTAVVAASRATVAFASRALLALAAALGPVGAIIAIVVAAAVALGLAVRGLVSVFSSTSTATERATISLEELDKKFGNSIERASSLSAELTRLGKTIRDNIDLPLRGGEVLGQLPFAQAATKIKQADPTVSRADALKKAAEEAGGFEGIIRQVSQAIGEGSQANAAYAKEYARITEEADRTFKSLNDVEKAAKAVKAIQIEGGAIALEALSNGNTQAAETLGALISEYQKLGQNISKATGDVVRGRAFERIIANLDELRDSSNEGAKEIVKLFDDAAAVAKQFEKDGGESFLFAEKVGDQVREFTADSTKFFQLFRNDAQSSVKKIADEFRNLQLQGGLLKASVDGIKTAISQTSSATKSVTNLFKNAALGGESFAKAQEVAAQRIAEAKDSLERVTAATENAQKRLRESLQGTNQFKEAEDFIKNLDTIKVDLLTQIDDAQALQEANRIFALIDRQNKAFTAQQVKDIKSLGGAFASTIGDALTGATRGADVFNNLADAFKKQFVDEVQKDISLLFGDRFKNQIRQAVDVARGVVESAQLSGTLFSGLQDGTLQQQINAAIQAAVPGIQQIAGEDIFNLSGSNKLAEQFRSVFTDASVALVTAGNRSAALLENLQNVLSEGPARDRSGLQRQATELRNLLTQAAGSGANDAIRPIEQALSGVLSQLQNSQPPIVVQQITTAAERLDQSFQNGSSVFSQVIQSLAPAATSFITTIEQGFRRIQETEFGQIAGDLIENFSQSGGGNVNVTVESNGALNVSVEATGSSGGGGTSAILEEDEIRDIIAETREGLLLEVDEKLRRLEEELRRQ